MVTWFANELLPALISAITAAGLAIWVFRRQQTMQSDALRQRLRAALIADIETLRERYMEMVGNHLNATPPGQLLRRYSVIHQEYFTVYNSICNNLGIFNQTLVREIVAFYVSARGIVDTLALHGNIILQIEQLELAVVGATAEQRGILEVLRQARMQQALQYQEQGLRPSQLRVLEQADRVLRLLRQGGD